MLAKRLAYGTSAAPLSLDDIAFARGSERRPLEESIAEVKRFIAQHESWIIEGCYADIIGEVIEDDYELVFLNPGVEVRVTHCRARSWEPESVY